LLDRIFRYKDKQRHKSNLNRIRNETSQNFKEQRIKASLIDNSFTAHSVLNEPVFSQEQETDPANNSAVSTHWWVDLKMPMSQEVSSRRMRHSDKDEPLDPMQTDGPSDEDQPNPTSNNDTMVQRDSNESETSRLQPLLDSKPRTA